MSSGPERIAGLLDEVSHLLPAQGPISVFIHHNTLHAFEDRPFEEAVVEAGKKLGCAPFLSEARYREELARGRITEADVAAVLEGELGERGRERIAGHITRLELRRRMTLHGVPEASGAALSWLLAESPALRRFRPEAPHEAWEHVDPSAEEAAVRALFDASLEAALRATPLSPSAPRAPVRHQGLLLAAHGIDTDELVHPVLIRFTAAYLDQGLAQRSMPGRERGMYACFLELYGSPAARLTGEWARALPALVAREHRADRSAEASIEASLEALGVSEAEQHDFLLDTALALRGFAGMVRQLEQRPDRVPAHELPARLADFLAVRLLLERVALAHAARSIAFHGPLRELREHLREAIPAPSAPSATERAWPLFQLAQLAGIDAPALDRLGTEEIDALERELRDHDGVARRRALHLAYERHLRHRFFDALSAHAPEPGPSEPDIQAFFCLDEREESFRRHLEEVDSGVETLGTAGFYGVAMYYRGASDAHPRPLCPVAVRPEHYVAEAAADGGVARLERLGRRGAGLVGQSIHVGSRTLVRGSLVAILGVLSAIPLVLRVVFPWLARRLARARAPLPRAETRLEVERTSAPPPIGRHSGFTVEEQASIVGTLLENAGVARLAPLVIVLGHGSVSLNNPHESAHDCGACGGGHGGPNARAFAQMANDPRVRALLRERGRTIDEGTWFVGGERNTASNEVALFDLDRVPEAQRALLARARRSIDRARAREAHERCRKFELVPGWFPPLAAAMHVEGRAADLAQPRPEYGHATNAFCVVGRRARTRGLFFDRRAFLVSYDPTRDPSGAVLERLLGAVVPVVAGISLEYWFGYVDPAGYGCGTKLPHNVTSLLGVMDGAASDLRTGLPWQMLEIHEPVRLTMVVEREPEELERILRASPTLSRLVLNRWITLACLDPSGAGLSHYGPRGFARYAPERPLEAVVGGSVSAYRGERGPLPFVRIAS